MKKVINQLRQHKIVLILLIFTFLVMIGTVFANFYTEVVIPNRFKTLTYNVKIEEEFNDDWGVKKVYFVNTDETNTPVVLRINYNELWSKTKNNVFLTLDNNVNGENVVEKNWTNNFSNDFVKSTDGWYYYKKILKPNEKVQVLDSISLNKDLIKLSPYYEDYKTFNYELSFNFEAVQATEKAVKEIWNYDISIDNDNVSW